jgi:hypothetical protein
LSWGRPNSGPSPRAAAAGSSGLAPRHPVNAHPGYPRQTARGRFRGAVQPPAAVR